MQYICSPARQIFLRRRVVIFLRNMSKKGKVLVAMSGGIDSTITALDAS